MAIDGYWGLCPICKKTDGYINIGRGHWFFCKKHRVCWFVGSNLFSGWREETEAEQRRLVEEIGINRFKTVKPFYPKIEGVKRTGDEGGNEPNPGIPSEKTNRRSPIQIAAVHGHRGKQKAGQNQHRVERRGKNGGEVKSRS